VECKETTLVVAQTWAEVHRVNEAIREALRGAGQLGRGMRLRTFRPVDATVAQRRDPHFYTPGQHVYFLRRYGRFAKGDVCEVRGATARGVLVHKAGVETTLGFRYADRLAVAEAVPLEVAPGDRLQLKLNGRSSEGVALNNGELVTVRHVRRDGGIVAVDAAGRAKTIAPAQQLLTRGFAVTSYAAQGKTVDTVLFADAQCAAATSRNQWYVTISRGRKRVVVFTSDKDALRAQIARTADRPLALHLRLPVVAPRLIPPAWVTRARAVIAHLHQRACLRRRHPAPNHQIRRTR
jgi:ATP-dependent exoDNAse (exonuclease V) alpha subunit